METVEEINSRLLSYFGRFPGTNLPRFRVVKAWDEIEKRWVTHNEFGVELIQPRVAEVPKYRQWKNETDYILELVVAVPEGAVTDLVSYINYEPLWTFVDNQGKSLPPRFDVCRILIENMENQMQLANTFVKYKEKNETPEEHEARIQDIADKLFGNESSVGTALAHKRGVSLANTQKDDENAAS